MMHNYISIRLFKQIKGGLQHAFMNTNVYKIYTLNGASVTSIMKMHVHFLYTLY